MAISYSISYTFTAGTTISSSQVNTNFSDNSNTWTGLEALTKSFSNLRVDATPTATTDVAIKSYVDKLNNYRRPVLQYSSGTVVNIETGINGTSGQAQIVFPDGTLRTDSTTTRIHCNLAQNAVLSGTAQSGIRSGAAGANTWYSFYAVKVTDSTANFVTVADTVIPTQANYATLNTNFGTNGWVYLGAVTYGDNAGSTTAVPKFVQAGHTTMFYNDLVAGSRIRGLRLATTAGAATLTWTYAAGTALGSGQIPAHILLGDMIVDSGNAGQMAVTESAGTMVAFKQASSASAEQIFAIPRWPLTLGMKTAPGAAVAQDIALTGFFDGVLGIGANPIL